MRRCPSIVLRCSTPTGPSRVAYEATFTDELEDNDFDRSILDAALASIPSGELVLDVGCGPAQVSRWARAAGRAAVGIDLTPTMLAFARRHEPRLPLTCGDVLALPYKQSVAAAAIAWYSLHNLPRRLLPLALTELRRVVRPGGVAVIATHGGTGEEVIGQPRVGRSDTVTVTYYEADELTALAAECGLLPTRLQERPPLEHEHQVQKLYLTATMT